MIAQTLTPSLIANIYVTCVGSGALWDTWYADSSCSLRSQDLEALRWGCFCPSVGLSLKAMPGWNFLSWRARKSDLSRQGEKLRWRGKGADPSGSEKLSCQIDVGDTSPRQETLCSVPVLSLAWLETARQPSWRGQSDGRSSFLVSMHTFPEDSSSMFCYGLGFLVYQLLFGFWFDFLPDTYCLQSLWKEPTSCI